MEQSLEQLSECPSCGSHKRETHIKCLDYTCSEKLFKIDACLECGLLYTNPRPYEPEIGPYYNNPEYVSHTDIQKGLIFKLYRRVKTYTLRKKRLFLESISGDRTALDYGAGSGDFSSELLSHGWKVIAYEPDQSARDLLASKSREILLVDTLETVKDQSVSVITLWHVLEHVHRLNETIDHFKRILKPDGQLIIAVPNHLSFDARHYREDWAAYDVPRHLYHFNPSSIDALMSKRDFINTNIKPMWFDSFYVSLLSEKNKRTFQNKNQLMGWPKALLVGLASNVIALFSKSRCSSLTYSYRKQI